MREAIKKALEDLAYLQDGADDLEEEVEFLGDAIKWLQQAQKEAIDELERESAEACPGCGCKPGDGITESCEHPEGCGYFKSEEAQP
jgi:formate dehydrogenase maturation protein FdhE